MYYQNNTEEIFQNYEKTVSAEKLKLNFMLNKKRKSTNYSDCQGSITSLSTTIDNPIEIRRNNSNISNSSSCDSILENFPDLPFNKNVLNGPPIEQVFLIKEIFNVE